MGLSIKKLPGVKQIRRVKDKTALKLFKEVESSTKEREQFIKDLKAQHDKARGLIDDMSELIAEFEETDDVNEMHNLLKSAPDYDKQVAIMADCVKGMKKYEKQLQRLQKVESGLLKIASKDAVVKELLDSK